jgi:TPP-dependent pyruvate/acetoin dehydrogenase alpha subunit
VYHAREGRGPSLIEAKTYRFYGHHPNDPGEYRGKKEVEYYKNKKDPLVNFRKKLLKEKVITIKEIEVIEGRVIERIKEAVAFAEKSPEPRLDVFLKEMEKN